MSYMFLIVCLKDTYQFFKREVLAVKLRNFFFVLYMRGDAFDTIFIEHGIIQDHLFYKSLIKVEGII